MKILKYIVISIVALVILTEFLFPPIGNNAILLKHTNNLKHFKLNADYEILATDSKCGKLSGNGNGMQYFSALLIHSKDDLIWENNDWEGVFLVDINDSSFGDFISEYNSGPYCKNIKKSLKGISNTEHHYVLYSFYTAPLDSIWNNDLRAH